MTSNARGKWLIRWYEAIRRIAPGRMWHPLHCSDHVVLALGSGGSGGAAPVPGLTPGPDLAAAPDPLAAQICSTSVSDLDAARPPAARPLTTRPLGAWLFVSMQ